MTDNKTLGQIAYEAASKSDHDPIPWDDPLNKDLGFHVDWEAAGQAVRRAVIDECIQKLSGPLTIAAPPDVISAVQDLNELHIEALEGLKGETDVTN